MDRCIMQENCIDYLPEKTRPVTLITLRNALVTLENKLSKNEADLEYQRNDFLKKENDFRSSIK